MITYFMGLVITASLIMCMIDGTLEYLTITIIAVAITLLFRYSEPDDDGLTQEQSALSSAFEGMERRKSRKANRRPLWGTSDQEIYAAPSPDPEFERVMEQGRAQERRIWGE